VTVTASTTLGTLAEDSACICGGEALFDLTSGTPTFDAESPTVDVTFLGPQATIAPAGFDFGTVAFGGFSPLQKFTVKNTGNEALDISSVSTDGTDFPSSQDLCSSETIHVHPVDLAGGDVAQFQRNATTCVDVDLDPGEICFVKVRFRPIGAPGPRSTQLVVDSDVPGSHSADLSGIATGV
jgi:hypothetical protein